MFPGDNISLKPYNTFGLDYKASRFVTFDTDTEAIEFFRNEGTMKGPFLIMGGGSNLLFTCDYPGTILHPTFGGIHCEGEWKGKVIISAGAGLEWDELVGWSVSHGFYGLENLSIIPGTAGASAVQNIGAYGAEVKNVIKKVETINVSNGALRTFERDECNFGYRTSIFKTTEKGRYMITRVWFELGTQKNLELDYGSLKDEVHRIGDETLENVRQAVINIRRSKLPDPVVTGNAGSFFKNPVVGEKTAEQLLAKFPKMPVFFEKTGSIKLAAGWLIEQCGWKGFRSGDAGVHERQALIIVNYGKATGEELFLLSEKIRNSVSGRFGIDLEREVEVIGLT